MHILVLDSSYKLSVDLDEEKIPSYGFSLPSKQLPFVTFKLPRTEKNSEITVLQPKVYLLFVLSAIKKVAQKTDFICPYAANPCNLKMFSIFSRSKSRIQVEILSLVVTLRHFVHDLTY